MNAFVGHPYQESTLAQLFPLFVDIMATLLGQGAVQKVNRQDTIFETSQWQEVGKCLITFLFSALVRIASRLNSNSFTAS